MGSYCNTVLIVLVYRELHCYYMQVGHIHTGLLTSAQCAKFHAILQTVLLVYTFAVYTSASVIYNRTMTFVAMMFVLIFSTECALLLSASNIFLFGSV